MGLSRNKVAVPEGAAGSPPFYGVLWAHGGAPMMGCFLFLAVWPGGVPCWLEKGQGACALVVWVGSGVVHAVGFPDRQAPCRGWCSVPAVLVPSFVGWVSGVVWCGGLRTGEWTRA